MSRSIYSYNEFNPSVGDEVFIAEGAKVIGKTNLKNGCNIWFNSVLRGDENYLDIGEFTNIQDGCILHNMSEAPCIIGNHVTVGHGAILHGCKVGNYSLIGMGAILLNNVEIGEYSIVGAGSLVTERKKIPPRSMVMGSPAKIIREVTDEEIKAIKESALHYYRLAQEYLTNVSISRYGVD